MGTGKWDPNGAGSGTAVRTFHTLLTLMPSEKNKNQEFTEG